MKRNPAGKVDTTRTLTVTALDWAAFTVPSVNE
jgi:hypothetical protein